MPRNIDIFCTKVELELFSVYPEKLSNCLQIILFRRYLNRKVTYRIVQCSQTLTATSKWLLQTEIFSETLP